MSQSFGSLLEVARIQSEINRLFDNLLDLGESKGAGGTWMPNVDILEAADCLWVKIELPGVSASEVKLSVHGGNIVIEGEKPRPTWPSDSAVPIAERAFGPFRRVIHLGVPVNTRLAKAVLNQGLLRISFPKVPNRRGEPVPIEVESA
jgi:HSP20 family protein